MKTKKPIVVLSFLFLMGCTYGYTHQLDVAYLKSYSFKPHQNEVELYFGSNKPQRPHLEYAIIEVKGAQFDDMNFILSKIKTKAQELGADAVIGLSKDFLTRERGSILDVFGGEKPEKYTAPVFTGIAIKYIDNIQ